MTASIFQPTWHHTPEALNLQQYHRKNLNLMVHAMGLTSQITSQLTPLLEAAIFCTRDKMAAASGLCS
jgi:hypothetical protein